MASCSRPGFTVVRSGVDLNELVTQLRQAGAPEGGTAWAVVKSYACTGQPGIRQTEQQYKEYLGGLLAHGAQAIGNIVSGSHTATSPQKERSTSIDSGAKSQPLARVL